MVWANCSLLVLLSNRERVKPVKPEVVAVETPRECFDRLPEETEERSEELELIPMEVRVARALDVFSRARRASDRRLPRDIEPVTELGRVVDVAVDDVNSGPRSTGGKEP